MSCVNPPVPDGDEPGVDGSVPASTSISTTYRRHHDRIHDNRSPADLVSIGGYRRSLHGASRTTASYVLPARRPPRRGGLSSRQRTGEYAEQAGHLVFDSRHRRAAQVST